MYAVTVLGLFFGGGAIYTLFNVAPVVEVKKSKKNKIEEIPMNKQSAEELQDDWLPEHVKGKGNKRRTK